MILLQRMPKQLCLDSSSALSEMNAALRAIDLVCLIGSPILSGCLMTYSSPTIAVAALSAYCLVAWVPELVLLKWACGSSEKLRWEIACLLLYSVPILFYLECQRVVANLFVFCSAPKATASNQEGEEQSPGCLSCHSMVVYFRQSVLIANLSLACLYMTVSGRV